ncbi:MAG: alpha/beta hydrolase-fold protein [Phycisphaerales bacterium JB050]
MHTCQIIAVLLAVFGFVIEGASAREAREQRVRFVVQIPTTHYGSDLYLACNANNWSPSAERWKLRPSGADQPGRYTIDVPVAVIPNGTLEYKFTKGSWDTVELNADHQDVPNRTLSTEDLNNGDPVHEIAITIPAFGDERLSDERESTVVGTLEIFDFTSATLGNTRKIRVWLPKEYAEHPDRDYPVLYMHDGQNCFDEATSSFGWEWRIDETMTELIEAGDIPPMIVVGIDNAGADRSWEYNASYTAFGNREPYGEKYVAMLVDELMPDLQKRYRVKTGPEHTALGGSSFGGNITMLAAMERPGVFGRLLIESPAVPVVGPKFLEAILAFAETGRWTPQTEDFTGRVFLAMGTKETDNEVYNQRLVQLIGELEPAFADENHRIVVEDGAVHNETAWAKRFPNAAKFLFGHR